MKTWNEEEYEEFFEEEYFTFQSPNLGENQTFWNLLDEHVQHREGKLKVSNRQDVRP